MIATQLTLISLIISTNALSIGTVSEQNVTKRETKLGDLFPDWVPFKNKHGEELGEFVQVKNKPKKRLAPPMNFILRAVADPEGDDYYEKEGGGGGDSEDYFEKKDWSDTNRLVITGDKPLNHTEISDIDGVVNIITQPRQNPVVDLIVKERKPQKMEEEREENIKEAEGAEEDEDGEKKLPDRKEIIAEETKAANRKKSRKYEEADYEEEVDSPESGKRKQESFDEEQERSESEAKKARILNTVDELKQRHAQEQVAISEKAKEEEMYKEEHEREKIQAQLSSDPEAGKYDYKSQKSKKKYPDYEEYDEKDVLLSDKYRPMESPVRITTTNTVPSRTAKGRQQKENKIESGKLSVFKNPQLYMIFDDDSSETTTTSNVRSTNNVRSGSKYSAKYSTSTPANKVRTFDRISLVPEGIEGKEGEPALFFPRKRKNLKSKNRFSTENNVLIKTTVPEVSRSTVPEVSRSTVPEVSRSTVPEISSTRSAVPDVAITTVPDVAITTVPDVSNSSDPDTKVTRTESYTTAAETTGTGNTGTEITGNDTTGSDSISLVTTLESGPSATDLGPTHTEPVTDALPASTKHHTEPEKTLENYHREKGGGREHQSEHEKEHSEKGKKAYEGVHEETRTSKGHHDKENHLGKYDDHGGVDEKHEEESGHYGDHHHEEQGKKHAKYEESGKHSKGHSTKGSHDIHKKEEYEKKVEFFEEEGDSGEDEKHGGFNEETGHSKGGHFKNGNYNAGHEERAKGESGHFAKGDHLLVSKGHKAAVGHDNHGKNGESHHKKAAKDGGKKWIYHQWIPAKTANLVLIDRRADQLYHGLQYYG